MQPIKRFKLINKCNMQVELCDFGARILSIRFPNSQGELLEMTQNYKNDWDILNDNAYMGATVGRVCNRISGAQFQLNGNAYQLNANENGNTLHGGNIGFDRKFWKTKGVKSSNCIKFEMLSVDGDEGFPGDVNVSVIYRLTEDNKLVISYNANTTKPTPINLCNHTYFTLGESSVKDMAIQLNSHQYLPVDTQSIPLGYFEQVENTKFDLRTMTNLSNIDTNGYDHCFKIDNPKIAKIHARNTRICLDVETNQIAFNLYTGNFLPEKQSAICLEAQGFTDSMNHPNIPSYILLPTDRYEREVMFRFSIY